MQVVLRRASAGREKLYSRGDNLSFSSVAPPSLHTHTRTHPFLVVVFFAILLRKTYHVCCACVCYLRFFFFMLLQVRFFILFWSRTRHNIKRTRFSCYRRRCHTTILYASYSMRAAPSARHSRYPFDPTIFPTFFLHTHTRIYTLFILFLFFRTTACSIYI